MAGRGYSAGRVYLQVVPSYDNFMNSLRRDARGPLGKAIADAFETELAKSGTKSGEAFGKRASEGIKKTIRVDALTDDLQKKLGKALNDVADDSSNFGQRLKTLQQDIEATGQATDEHIKRQRDLSREMLLASQATDDAAKKLRLLGAASNLDPSGVRQFTDAQKAAARETENAGRQAAATAKKNKELSNSARDGEKDTNIFSRSLTRLSGIMSGNRNDAQDGANAFRFFNFAILGAAAVGAGLIPVLVGVAGGLVLLGPILGGLGAALGVAALGFSGVAGAVQAMSQQQDAAASSTTGSSRTMINAARAVADARRSLKDAYRNSGESIERAIASQADAERSLASAQRDARDAQNDLTAARKQAKQEQRDLATTIAQNQLDERQGVIDLFNAYNQYGAVQADGGSTNLEREQADIALKQAQLNLVKIRDEEKRLAEQKKKSAKEGIDGSEAVRSATRKLTDAIERQREASRNLAQATRDVSRARADGARSIADAQRALTRAQEDFNLSAEGGAAAINKVEQAMSKLSPAAQKFARYLFSLKRGFGELRAIAATGMLPGVEDMFRRIIGTYGPGMKGFVGDMSSLLGDLAVEIGQVFTNPVWSDFFSDMRSASLQFTSDAVKGSLGFMSGFIAIMDEAIPSSRKLSTYIKEIGERFGAWAASDKGRESIRKFFAYVEEIGPKVKDFFVSVAKALLDIGIALAPIGESVLAGLTSFFTKVSELDPRTIRVFAVGLAIAVIGLQSAAGIMAVISLSAAVIGAPLLLIVGALAGIAAGFFLLSQSGEKNSKLFKDISKSLTPILDSLKGMKKALEPVMKAFTEIAGMVKDELVKTFNTALVPAITSIVDAFKKDLLPAFEAFWPVIRPLVKFLIGFFGDTLRYAIGGIKDVIVGLIKVFSGLLEFITGVFTNDWGMALGGLKKIFFGALRAILGIVKLVFVFGVGAAFRGAWKLIRLIFTKGAGGIRGIFRKLVDGVRYLAFRGMEAASGIFRGAIGKITGFFTGLKDKVLAGMGKLRDGLKTIFEKIRQYVGNPIISVIDLVINRGLIGSINKLAGYAGFKGKGGKGVVGKVPLPAKYAKGGIHGVRPGYTPGRDNQVIAVGGGEAIMRPEWTRGVGAGFVNQMNLIARRGGASAVRAAMGGARAFAKGGVVWPTNTKALSGDYPGHTGVDIRAGMGAPIFAAQAGRVIAANRWNRSYGYHARIRGTDGIESVYAHMSKLIAKVGQIVKPGTRIGNVGSTGNSSGPHLHFEVRPGGTRATALAYLNNGKIPAGGGIIDKLAGLGKGAISALKNPLNYFNKRLSGAFSRIGGLDGFAGTLMKGIPKKLVGGLVSKVKSLAFKGLGVGKDFFVGAGKKVLSGARAVAGLIPGIGGKGGAGPKLYDNGGMLPTGLSLVMNKTSRPEPVLTGEQWDRMKQGGGGSTYHITGNGADPEALAKHLVDKLRFEQRRARRSGTLAGKVA